MARYALMVFAALALVPATVACGGAQIDRDQTLRDLRRVLEEPLQSREQSEEHSRVVENALSNDVLQGMTREQVRAALGPGDDCSRHPRCAENGFESDDWHYTAGVMGDAPVGHIPAFIVGFDRSGYVTRTWSLRVE